MHLDAICFRVQAPGSAAGALQARRRPRTQNERRSFSQNHLHRTGVTTTRLYELGFGNWGLAVRDQGFGGLGFRVQGLGSEV